MFGTMVFHTAFDLLAWGGGALLFLFLGRWQSDIFPSKIQSPLASVYFAALSAGALSGAFVLGTLNLAISHHSTVGRSILGSLIGAIIAIETLKTIKGVKGSTGLRFAAPAALGIAIGRIGCFLSGIDDFTYGTPTNLPWGYNFGDGIIRHPVQLYESVSMLVFTIVCMLMLKNRSPFIIKYGFYTFTGWYAFQRFIWEFLKPYTPIWGPFNTFHMACMGLLIYSMFMMIKERNSNARP